METEIEILKSKFPTYDKGSSLWISDSWIQFNGVKYNQILDNKKIGIGIWQIKVST